MYTLFCSGHNTHFNLLVKVVFIYELIYVSANNGVTGKNVLPHKTLSHSHSFCHQKVIET